MLLALPDTTGDILIYSIPDTKGLHQWLLHPAPGVSKAAANSLPKARMGSQNGSLQIRLDGELILSSAGGKVRTICIACKNLHWKASPKPGNVPLPVLSANPNICPSSEIKVHI